ncbi:hypothetical protein [Peribacillus sp. SCS-37]|uniref:hypothetical protein n=1 Tax=Paraperibacillus esterisolvens TaxID=3115296 RepID=UPI003906596C
MLKLPEETRYRQLPNHVQLQLEPFSILNIKPFIFGFTFILLDAIILVPLLVPRIEALLFITLPLIGFVNIWALALLFRKPYKTELESLLFLGFLGGVGAISYFILFLKYSFMAGINTWIFYVIMTVIFLLIVYFFMKHQLIRYSKINKEPEKKTPNWHYKLLSIAAPVGYLLAQYIKDQPTEFVLCVMSLVFLYISIFYVSFLAKYLHKYLFIKKNKRLVSLAKDYHN